MHLQRFACALHCKVVCSNKNNRKLYSESHLQAGVLERRLFYMPSFKIYGSGAGFYDYGPPGCAVKQNITQFWRQHFVLEEDMLQVAMHANAAIQLLLYTHKRRHCFNTLQHQVLQNAPSDYFCPTPTCTRMAVGFAHMHGIHTSVSKQAV